MICYLYDAPQYLFLAADLPALLYYSHIPAAITALLVGLFVYLNRRDELKNKLLFLISLCFVGWTTINLITWTNINADILLFAWTFFGILQAAISILSIYFIYVFLTGEDVSRKVKSVFTLLMLPVILFAQTDLNISGFDLDWCDAFGFEGIMYLTYYSLLGVLAMLWIGVLLVRAYMKETEHETRKQIVLMGAGIESFLLIFFSITFLASYLANIGLVDDSDLEFYGLFGMVIFMIFIGVLIVRFKTFKIGLHVSQALVAALLILTASKYTFSTSTTDRVLTTITLVLVAIAGYILIKSVKKEVEQRTEIEKLANRLERANRRLKKLDQLKSEFVSIASHQLRSPLTAIRGYASMLMEGSFGKLTPKAKEAVEKIGESSRFMALSVEDYLNVSRIQTGNMKYENSDFNVRDLAESVADELRPEAIRKGLLISFKTDMDTKGVVHADIGKTKQVIQNLVDNSMKYTPKGSIKISVHDNKRKKRIYIDIIDTGIGMSKETLQSVFDKFERAENANYVNVTGTGLGLFVARQMARAMDGDVYATSEGEGEGSTFTVELPVHL